MSFSTCTQYWYPCPQNSLFPQLSHQEFWTSCGDDLGRTSEMGWGETGFLLYSDFSLFFLGWWELLPRQKEQCWVTATPLCSPPLHLQMAQGRAEGTTGEQQLCLAHKPLTNGDAKNHTQQQCGITQTFWENRWFKAIHAPFQRDIQKCGRIVILKTVLTGLRSADLERGLPH